MKSITDPTFRYVPAIRTDIRRTFARARRQLQQRQALWQPMPDGGYLPLLPAQRKVQQLLDEQWRAIRRARGGQR
jgi:hypothetical protein